MKVRQSTRYGTVNRCSEELCTAQAAPVPELVRGPYRSAQRSRDFSGLPLIWIPARGSSQTQRTDLVCQLASATRANQMYLTPLFDESNVSDGAAERHGEHGQAVIVDMFAD